MCSKLIYHQKTKRYFQIKGSKMIKPAKVWKKPSLTYCEREGCFVDANLSLGSGTLYRFLWNATCLVCHLLLRNVVTLLPLSSIQI